MIAPTNGWDNAADVEEGKTYCRDMAWAISRNKQGLDICSEMAGRLRDFGISCDTAIMLVLEFAEPLLPEQKVKDAMEHWYQVAATAPGLLSKAAPIASPWQDAEDEEIQIRRCVDGCGGQDRLAQATHV